MYKVLHIMFAADIGGISAFLLNYYRFMDREKIHFDVVLTSDREGLDAQHFRELGTRFFHMPPKSQNYSEFENALVRILTEGEYDCIHIHENTTSYVALRIAKKVGIRSRIAHSHTSAPSTSLKDMLKRLSGCVLNYHYATTVIACGKLAGDRVFGKRNMRRAKAMILPNAIDTDVYAFDPQIRDKVRRELGLEGKFAIGMVGRLAPEKNIPYALALMEQLRVRIPDAVMLVVGNGGEEGVIRRIIAEKKLEACVTLLGSRADVYRLYQAMDALLMPSFHEGFPVAAVEAMASGLPVLLSDTITRELDFGTARYLKLDDDEAWIQTLQILDRNADRSTLGREVKDHGLDIRDTVKRLEELYLTGKNEA